MELNVLRRQRDVISLEAVSGEAAFKQAITRLPDFFAGLKASFSKSLLQPVTNFFAAKDLLSFARRISMVKYSDMRQLEAFVPQGLTTDLLSYGQSLEKGTKAAEELVKDVLEPFVAWLGEKLGNPSSLASVVSTLEIKGYKGHDLDKLNALIADSFATAGRRESTVPYGQAIRRNGDWLEIAKLANSLDVNFTKQFHAKVQDLMHEAETRLGLLIERIEKEPEHYKLSNATIQQLSNAAFQVAAELEFYGLLRFRIDEYAQSIKMNVDKFHAYSLNQAA